MQGIYRIRNKINDKRYTGSTNDFEGHWEGYRKALRKGVFHNIHLQRAWNKYGECNFAFEVEEEVVGDSKALLAIEQIYLDEGFELGILYNIAKIAGGGDLGYHGGMLGKSHTQKTKDKMSRAHKGKGHKHTEETKAQIKKKVKKSWATPERREGRREYWTPEKREECSRKTKSMWDRGVFDGRDLSGENHPSYGKPGYWAGKKNPEHSKRMSGEGNSMYGTHHTEGWKHNHSKWMIENSPTRGKEINAEPYPAFFNIKTKKYLPAGCNLSKLCRKNNLAYYNMNNLRKGNTKQSRDGWRLATEEEIEERLRSK